MLIHRVWSALLFAPALLAMVWLGGTPLAITCLVVSLLMQWEFMRLTLGSSERYLHIVGYVLGAAACATLLGWVPTDLAVLAVPLGTLVLMGAVMARPGSLAGAVTRGAMVALGVLYGACLFPFIALLRDVDGIGLGLALSALFCTWGADTGAYFAGRALGRHKLYPKISPGKTVEGAVGGVAAAVGSAFLIRWMFDVELTAGHTAAIGALAGAVGIVGDLSESLLKRSVGAKDSSSLIPGHGGVLDRFDGVMFVAPALFAYVRIVMTP